jgi:hypothetical protein
MDRKQWLTLAAWLAPIIGFWGGLGILLTRTFAR